ISPNDLHEIPNRREHFLEALDITQNNFWQRVATRRGRGDNHAARLALEMALDVFESGLGARVGRPTQPVAEDLLVLVLPRQRCRRLERSCLGGCPSPRTPRAVPASR